MPRPRLLPRLLEPPRFESLFLFVTSRCNARCGTCFYHGRLNSEGDLSREELGRLSHSLPPFTKLWYSGGEPFLRPDLGEITDLFVAGNGVRRINLPTNGLLGQRARQVVGGLLERHPGLEIDLNLSLDGLPPTHDRIRGVPGNFAEAMASLAELAPLRQAHPGLKLNVLSVITGRNLDDLLPLGRRLLAEQPLDGHYFEVVRGQPEDPDLTPPRPADLERLHRDLRPIHAAYARRRYRRHGALDRWLREAYYQAGIHTHYRLQRAVLARDQPWPVNCTAGQSSLVVEHDGLARVCELRQPLGNLRDFAMDYRRLAAETALGREIETIAAERCRCTHSCFLWDTLRLSPRGYLWEVPRSLVSEGLLRSGPGPGGAPGAAAPAGRS